MNPAFSIKFKDAKNEIKRRGVMKIKEGAG